MNQDHKLQKGKEGSKGKNSPWGNCDLQKAQSILDGDIGKDPKLKDVGRNINKIQKSDAMFELKKSSQAKQMACATKLRTY